MNTLAKAAAARMGGLSDQAVADSLGLDRRAILRLRRGMLPQREPVRAKIAGWLGVSMAQLLEMAGATLPQLGREIRTRRGELTQDELAARLRVSRCAVNRWERGISVPGEHAEALAAWMGVSVEQVVAWASA